MHEEILEVFGTPFIVRKVSTSTEGVYRMVEIERADLWDEAV